MNPSARQIKWMKVLLAVKLVFLIFSIYLNIRYVNLLHRAEGELAVIREKLQACNGMTLLTP
jgi:hypothetical protein